MTTIPNPNYCLRCWRPCTFTPRSTGRCVWCQFDAIDAGQGDVHESKLRDANERPAPAARRR